MDADSRKSHAILDLASRYLKAKKIRLLTPEIQCLHTPIKLLEIGTGSGGIAHYFATQTSNQYQVSAVDVQDSRMICDSYDFYLVNDIHLPFADNSFDLIISNHVIEHVGAQENQRLHLQEIYRVLKPSGMVYLAVPNRWMLIEPHYKLIFLSWLPKSYRNSYLYWRRGVDIYDCEPLELKELEAMLRELKFKYSNRSVDALFLTIELEMKGKVIAFLLRLIPAWIYFLFRPVIPTLIFTFRKIEDVVE